MKIYAGETIKGVMVLKDDDNQPISDLSSYDITMMLRNKFDDYQIVLQKSSMSISGSQVGFEFSSEQTKKLDQVGVFELKVTKDGVVKIAKEDIFYVIDNKIKDVE